MDLKALVLNIKSRSLPSSDGKVHVGQIFEPSPRRHQFSSIASEFSASSLSFYFKYMHLIYGFDLRSKLSDFKILVTTRPDSI